MASKAKLNMRGINKVLRAAQSAVDDVGEAIASSANGNYEYVKNPHRWTARGHVQSADAATAREDARSNELLKAVGRNIR